MQETHTEQRTRTYCGYVRVSTARQGQSGLSLEHQLSVVATYSTQNDGTLIRTFTEVESGRKNDRRELVAALDFCRRTKATLVVATLSRLSRNAEFLLALQRSKVDFVCCDFPQLSGNRLMLGVLALVAEEEARQTSIRTKNALAQAKLHGVQLGKSAAALAERNKSEADKHALELSQIVLPMVQQGMTANAISAALNRLSVPTPRKGVWHCQTAKRLLAMVARLQSMQANEEPLFG